MKNIKLSDIYTFDNIENQKLRFKKLLNLFNENFTNKNDNNIRYFSTPGRTEIGGNHTDHNHGKVIAASINLDSIAVVQNNNSNIVKIYSEGFPKPFIVDITNLEIIESEKETTNALIRGIASGLKNNNYKTGGFNAYLTSDVLRGSGLSSSASIEVLLGSIFNNLFNDGEISPHKIAKIGQYAENQYFGKPCGLMDQMACSVGNIISIDFNNPEKPIVHPVNFDFASTEYRLIVLDTGGNHADLTEDYASIPKEMKQIANYFHKSVCREISKTEFYKNLNTLKNKFSHRAILRVLHFFNENTRVDLQVNALENSNIPLFLQLIKESGNSSFKWLQNIFTIKNPQEQGVSLALALTEDFLNKIDDGACRVHGGGFAGTIQIFIKKRFIQEYIDFMVPIFGKNSIQVLTIRQIGSTEITL